MQYYPHCFAYNVLMFSIIACLLLLFCNQAARHPCVELMDGVNFIANNYHFEKKKSNFQLVTGPNMVRQLSGTINTNISF